MDSTCGKIDDYDDLKKSEKMDAMQWKAPTKLYSEFRRILWENSFFFRSAFGNLCFTSIVHYGDVNKKTSAPIFFEGGKKKHPIRPKIDSSSSSHLQQLSSSKKSHGETLRSRCQRCTLHRQGRQEVRGEGCRPGRSHCSSNDVDQATEEGGTVARDLRFVRPERVQFLGKGRKFSPGNLGIFWELQIQRRENRKSHERWVTSFFKEMC